MSTLGIIGLLVLVAALIAILIFGRKLATDGTAEQGKRLNSALIFFAVGGIYAVIVVWLSFTFALALSSFAIGIAKTVLALFMVWLFDRYAVKEIDTMKLLEGDAIAYSIFLLGVFILASVCIATS